MNSRWGSLAITAIAFSLLLPSASYAAIVHIELQVEAINFDNFGTGLEVGDVIGYLEFDDASFAPVGGSSGGVISFYGAELTDFSLSFGGTEYRLDDLTQAIVLYATEDLIGDPTIFFEANNTDIYFGNSAQSVPLYRLAGHDPDDPVPTAFSIDFSANIVPLPAAVWLLGSGLGLLGWIRRKRV